jgi:hypothetical protein
MTLRRAALLLALIPAVLLPGCGNGNPVLPSDVTAAGLQITVEPNPVVAAQNPLTGSVTANYKIVITETKGLGGELAFVNGSVYDPTTGQLVSLNYFDTADLVVFVGKSRVEAQGTLSFTQSANYTLADFSKAALLTVSAQMKDDRGNTINASTLVNIQ